jgi:predicted nucleotidyltransferase
VEEAILFGSRALGTYKPASDVDIALKGEGVTSALAARLKFDIEEDTYSGVQAYAVRSFVLLWESLCVPTPPIYVAASSPFTSEAKGQFDT